MRKRVATFEDLVGCVLSRVTVAEKRDAVIFDLADGRSCRLHHRQDCCESVELKELDGTLDGDVLVDLVGEVLLATEDTKAATREEASESGTWTFYRIGTVKGTVVMRWLGESNGYYSESVDFEGALGVVEAPPAWVTADEPEPIPEWLVDVATEM